jgi:hypothetical protein
MFFGNNNYKKGASNIILRRKKKKLLETLNHFIVDIASPPENAHQDGSNAIIKGCMTI